MTKEYSVQSEVETKKIAKELASKLEGNETIILTGNLRFR